MIPDRIEIVEVAPRDGLQNEDVAFSTEDKVALINAAVDAGARRIEVASFVNPKRVPQMADGEAVVALLPVRADVSYIGLVLNQKGLDRALAAGLREINAVVVCSDTFGQKNQGVNSTQSVQVWAKVAEAARAAGIVPTVTLSVAFGCPYEGEVAVARVVDVVRAVAEAGPAEIALADTIGVAVPLDTAQRFEAVRTALDELGATKVRLRGHFHNTRNTGLASAWAAVQAGASALDASLGGLGGCPFAPNATGNIPTEDLVYLLERSGISTGIDPAGLLPTVKWLESKLGRRVPGLLSKAGVFPDLGQQAGEDA
ncbi:MAG: hydroxymethylglutaryl-CoA lyase [Acidimicrobiales bacterium]